MAMCIFIMVQLDKDFYQLSGCVLPIVQKHCVDYSLTVLPLSVERYGETIKK